MQTQTKNTRKPLALPVTLCHSCCHSEEEWFAVCDRFQQEADERNGRYIILRCTGYRQMHDIERPVSHTT